jgi:hypothetical protein
MIDDLDDVLHRTHTQGVGGQSGAGRRKEKKKTNRFVDIAARMKKGTKKLCA